MSSYVTDYFVRQKLGGINLTLNYLFQFPILSPSIFELPCPWSPSIILKDWLLPRALELIYTAEDMRPFARDMGYDGEPFVWDEERRVFLRAQIDAACFHLYLSANRDGTWKRCEKETDKEYKELVAAFPTPRVAVDYIMDTFPITKNHDISIYGSYRTKELILDRYDKLLPMIAQS